MGIRRNTGSMKRHGPGMGFTAQAARRMMIALTILGVLALTAGVGLTVVQRASALAYDVCASGCPYTSIQSAINAASPGATITVGPGTYNETVNIYQNTTTHQSLAGLKLVGPNTGVDPDAATRGPEAIINAGGSSTPAVTISAADVSVTGFTITGSTGSAGPSAGIFGPNASGAPYISDNIITGNWNGINDLAGSTVYIENNQIRDNTSQPGKSCYGSGPARCNGIFELASFSSLIVEHNTIDETYTGANNPADLYPHFQRAMSVTPNTAGGHVAVDYNTLINSSTFVSSTGEFNYNQVSGDFGVRLAGDDHTFNVIDNTFTDLSSQAVFTQNSYVGDNSNVVITGNTVTQDVGLLAYCGGLTELDGNSAVFDLDGLQTTKLSGGFNSISAVIGNRVVLSGTYSGIAQYSNGKLACGAVTSVQGVRVRAGAMEAVQITGNKFDGGNVGGPETAGLLLDQDFDAMDNLASNLNGNQFTRFTNGVGDNTTQAYTAGQFNCFTNNTSYGYDASGGHVVAQFNWWGAANGPAPAGSGNAITASTVDASNYLTSAPFLCSGPVTTNVQSSVNPLPLMVPFTLTAHLDTTTTSQLPVASAYYTINGGSPVSMSTTSGTFGQDETVNVSANAPAFASVGSYKVCVYGVDTFGDVGGSTCITLDVTTADTTTTVTSSVNPSGYGQSVTFDITVAASTGTPTGSVTLKDGATTLAGPLTLDGSGKASFTTSTLSVGSHPITADYAGDTSGSPQFAASSSKTLNQVVNKANTTTTVIGSPNPAVSGQTVTLTVHVVGAYGTAPTGTVTLKDGATTLGAVTLVGGVGSLTTSTLSVGTHNIAATYPGDSSHNGSTGYGAETITATPSVPTGTTNAYVRIVQASEAYTSADVSIDGRVTFPNVAACTAQPYFPITAGNHTVTVASPSGGAQVISKTLSLTAGQYYTLAVVGNSAKSVAPNILVFLDNVTVTPNQAKVRVYHLSDTLGSVQVKDGSAVVATSLAFGSATNYTNQAPGTATYSFQPTSGPAITDTLTVSANQVYSIFLMCNGQVSNAAAAGVPQSLPQTGNGPVTSWLAPWLTPTLVMILLIVGAILLLAGSVGLGSYYVIAQRRGSTR